MTDKPITTPGAPPPAAAKSPPRPRLRRAPAAHVVAPAAGVAPSPPTAKPRRRRAERSLRPPPAPTLLWGVGLGGAGALLVLVGLLAQRNVETIADPWDPTRVAVYALLLVGPAALFWAAGQALRMGAFWAVATLAWAAFGYYLIFITPPAPGSGAGAPLIIFLALCFAAVTAALTPPLYAAGWAIFTQRLHRHDLRRAVRQASLLGLFAVACLGMSLFSVFNGLNALLLFVVLALAEFFFLSRG